MMDELLNIPAYRDMLLGNWDRMAEVTGSLGPNYDYSLLDARDIGSGHYGDAGKLPWHPTFSDQSIYSTPEFTGGIWNNNSFTPSLDQLRAGYAVGLMDYFNAVEPNAVLNRTPPLSEAAWLQYVGGR